MCSLPLNILIVIVLVGHKNYLKKPGICTKDKNDFEQASPTPQTMAEGGKLLRPYVLRFPHLRNEGVDVRVK